MIGIYCIRNTINNHRYIGQTIHIEVRKSEHLSALRRKVHFNVYLQHAFDQYGESNFVFEILEICEADKLSEREIAWIQHFGGYNSSELYNLTDGGKANYGKSNPRYGKHWSEDWKHAQSVRMKNYLSNPTNHPRYGKKHSPETIEKFRASRIGITHSAESRKKCSETLKNKYASGEITSPMKGKHHSDQTKEKIRKINMGRKHTEQELCKMSKALQGDKNPMYGKHHSEECRKHLSETHKGVRNYMYGKVRINNGVINMSIPKGDPLPEGFSYGMLPRKQNCQLNP